MIVKKEISTANEVRDLVWSGAVDKVADLSDGQIESILNILEDSYPDGMSETELNDFFWFDDNTYAEWLGYRDAEQMWERAGKDDSYFDIDYQVRVGFFENPQFTTSESLADQIYSIIDFEDDYDFVNDEDETYDEETDTYDGYVVIDISQAGMDKLRDANVEFEEV